MDTIKRILLIEDNPKDAALVKSILSKKGSMFTLDVASTGEKALEMMNTSLPDLVLLDYNLPGMDGLEVLQRIGRNKWQMPIVMLTGSGDELVAAEAIKQGAADFVTKNSNIVSTLLPIIQKLLEGGIDAYKSVGMFIPSQMNVLYVEDNINDAELIQRHFVKYSSHIHITWISDTGKVIEMLKSNVSIDCALLDLRLIQTNAIALMKDLVKTGYKFPFVVITGKGNEESAVAAMKLGAYDYISKRDDYISKLPHAIEMAVLKFRKDEMNQKLRQELIELNASLEQKVQTRTAELIVEISERKKAEEELKKRVNELQRWYDATLGRENRVVDLKKEVNELLKQAGKPPRYSNPESQEG
ncbi:MAG: response regulator [Bacteroidota bacterium]|nr:response regulator [Bacteroidota bacterium]